MTDLSNPFIRQYKGDGQRHHDPLPGAWHEPEPYVPSPELVEAVNLALFLSRPLLLEGEAGCGKTRLAYAVAYELGYPLFECYIRSTTRARDLLYTYDAVKRLYDISEGKTCGFVDRIPSREEYVTLGSLGNAIRKSQEDIPSVVLIDEIDKADIDFPNDLLLELDRFCFEVDEVGGEEAKGRLKYDALKGQTRQKRKDFLPLVIVTSNREKELPKPFLRRCLFSFIEFPNETILQNIIKRHFELKDISEFNQLCLKKFIQLREQRDFRWRKEPGTSEMLDWMRVVDRDHRSKKITYADLEDKSRISLPHLGSLIKTQSDLDALKK
jgi:MoxR-like ATPase